MTRYLLAVSQLFLLAAWPALCLAQPDDRWDFTRRELAECKRIELDRKYFPFSMIVPKTGYYRSAGIHVEDVPYLALNEPNPFLSTMRKSAIEEGHQIVAYERNLLIVDVGLPKGHYFYVNHPRCCVAADEIKSREDCLFRVKCAMSLRPLAAEEIHDKPIGSEAEAGSPASEYPRLTRRWSSKSGHHLDAQLAFVHADNPGVEFRKPDGRVVRVSIHDLEHTSGLIAADARDYFNLERALQGVLEAVNAGADPTSREFDSAVSAGNRSIGQPMLRYRVIGVSAQLPPKHTKSRNGEFRLSLRPLHRFQTLPSVNGKKLKAEYLDHWYFQAESFSPDMVELDKTIFEAHGRPQINAKTNPPAIHFQLTIEGEKSPLVWFGYQGGNPRLYTPGVGRATNALDTMFAGAATEKAPKLAESSKPAAVPDAKPVAPDAPVASLASKPRPAVPRIDPRGNLAEQLVRQANQQIRQEFADRTKAAGADRVPMPAGVAGKDRKRIAVTGSKTKRSFEAKGEDLGVSGLGNEVIVSGKCGHVSISGVGNRVIVEEVASISMSGVNNVVQYVRGTAGRPPEVRDVSRQNQAEKIRALPESR